MENGAASRNALVLFGTETGNAQDIAGEIAQILERLHVFTEVQELDLVNPQILNRYDLTVFAISTTGQGDFPINARKFWLSLRKKKLSSSFLSEVNYALVGLCDSSYPKFNFAGRKLDKRLRQLGAHRIVQPCEADEQGEDGTEGAFLSWSRLFRDAIAVQFPLSASQHPIPDSKRLPSKWILNEADSYEIAQSSNGQAIPTPGSMSSSASEEPYIVEVQQNDRITPSDHWQDVRLLKLFSEKVHDYLPGDALAIRPQNRAEDVNSILEILGWQSIADSLLVFRSANPAQHTSRLPDPVFGLLRKITLRELFTHCLDINAIPRRSFFANIAHFTDDEMQKERALEFTDPQYLDEYFDYATRPRRSILEVLQEFNTVRIPWTEAINIFPIIRPRQFSIASGGLLKQGGQAFELLVAIVKYRTVIKRVREGLCTKYLARLPIGTKLAVTLHKEGRFHAQTTSLRGNHLLIGGGTGMAPLRSLIYEKFAQTSGIDSTLLIFGCRKSDADYFFADEWNNFSSTHGLRFSIINAFSRDQQQKIYVQDRIREHAATVSSLLLSDDGTVIVCGSSGQMPKAVRQALKDALLTSENSIHVDEEAEQILSRLEKSGRYKQETW